MHWISVWFYEIIDLLIGIIMWKKTNAFLPNFKKICSFLFSQELKLADLDPGIFYIANFVQHTKKTLNAKLAYKLSQTIYVILKKFRNVIA